MTGTAPDVAQPSDIPQQDWSDLLRFRCSPVVLEAMADMGIRPYRDCAEAPTLVFADEDGVHLHGVPMAVAAAVSQVRAEKAPQPQPVPQPPLPGAEWLRAELPGRRDHEGWCREEARFGQPAAVFYDDSGTEIAAVYMGPGCRIYRVPRYVPQGYGYDAAHAIESADPWRGGDDDDSGEDMRAHADDCHDQTCDGDCIPGCYG